jgi:hypothetical protein
MVSGANFVPWTGQGDYHLIIDFRGVLNRNAAGQFEQPNRIVLSSSRDFNLKEGNRYRIAHTLIQHETLHFLNYRANPSADSYGHSKDISCAAHIGVTAPFLCPKEVLWLQSKFGKPSKRFFPIDKKLIWDELKPKRAKQAQLWETHRQLIELRKGLAREREYLKLELKNSTVNRDQAINRIKEINTDIGSVLNPQIRSALEKAKDFQKSKQNLEKKWKNVTNRWKNVPMVK